MRVTFVAPYPEPGSPPVGGVEVAAVRLVGGLHRRGIEATVVGLRGALQAPTGPIPLEFLNADERWSLLRGLRPTRRALHDVLRDTRPDIVHAEDLLPAGSAATRTSPEGTPCIVTAHGDRRQDTLSLYHRFSGHVRWQLSRRLVAQTIRDADTVVAVHPRWDLSLPTRPNRFVYIPNIVDERFFAVERRPEANRVLYCGGPRRIKGWDILLRAWPLVLRQIPNAHLHAPGCGDAVASIPAPLAPSIHGEGWLSRDRLADAMSSASIVVVPSRFELAPIAVGEAWAVGVPVVAAAVGGIPTLADGAARLVPPADPKRLADAIVLALGGDADTDRLVSEGRRRAEHQREERVVDAHLELYESLLAR